MSFKTSIWVGRFAQDAYQPREVIEECQFTPLIERFADRDQSGMLIAPKKRPGWEQQGLKKLIGYICHEMIIYHVAGFLEVIVMSNDPRLSAFLSAMSRELGCELINMNSGEQVKVADASSHPLGND